jgi:hypothetical protein
MHLMFAARALAAVKVYMNDGDKEPDYLIKVVHQHRPPLCITGILDISLQSCFADYELRVGSHHPACLQLPVHAILLTT